MDSAVHSTGRWERPAMGIRAPGNEKEQHQMIRNLKALGLAFFAVFAMTAVAATAAQGQQFQADAYPATVTSHSEASNHVFTINKGPVKCKTHHFEAESAAASTTLTVFATYKNCTFVGLNATVNMNGCHYVFHVSGGGGPLYAGTADVVCTGSNKIKVTSLQCTAEVGAQNGLSEVNFENVGEGDVEVGANVSGITYNTSGSCGISEASNGTYVGDALAEGFNAEEEPTEIFVE
jgi:hypothetical protein